MYSTGLGPEEGRTGTTATEYILATDVAGRYREICRQPLRRYLRGICLRDQLLSGFGGCNRFNGTYLLESKRGIKLTGLISTRMYCPESINQEQMLLQALSTASSYKIKGRKLSLYAGTQLVATFEAVTIRERNPVGE